MDKNITTINNLKIVNNEHVLVSVNPKIYSLDVVQSAAYVLMDRAYIVIDGDPKEKILVELKPTNKKEDLEKLGRDFNNELINYAVYKVQAERTKEIRETIVKRALLTNLGEEAGSLLAQEQAETPIEDSNQDVCGCESSTEEKGLELPEVDESNTQDYKEDPEGIMAPWGEKFSDDKEKGECTKDNAPSLDENQLNKEEKDKDNEEDTKIPWIEESSNNKEKK